jgi:hypothetical protein
MMLIVCIKPVASKRARSYLMLKVKPADCFSVI